MNTILRDYGDAVLGAELEPVKLVGNNCSPSDAITQALKSWAPTALVRSVRFASPSSTLLESYIFNARVYALHKGNSGDVVLQIWTGDGGPRSMSATVDLRLPVSPT